MCPNLNSANAVCPCCCILFGLGTCASFSGLREVTGLGHCPQNTNSLGASVWEKGGRAVGRSHELILWGWGGDNLIGCCMSQSPDPETCSLFDFALLMELSKVK